MTSDNHGVQVKNWAIKAFGAFVGGFAALNFCVGILIVSIWSAQTISVLFCLQMVLATYALVHSMAVGISFMHWFGITIRGGNTAYLTHMYGVSGLRMHSMGLLLVLAVVGGPLYTGDALLAPLRIMESKESESSKIEEPKPNGNPAPTDLENKKS